MNVLIRLKETSQQLIHTDIANTYQKGAFFCVYDKGENKIYKYPIENIWRVEEDYDPQRPTTITANTQAWEGESG
jgi:hypothetical protein